MQLIIDEKNIIEAYVRFGEIQRGIDFDEKSLPENFYENFKPSFYLLQNDEIVENPDYVAPSSSLPTGPSDLQTMIMQQAKTIAQIQQMLMQQNNEIAKLKGANA